MKPHPLLQEVIAIIVRTVPTEKIALLAFTSQEQATWNFFHPQPPEILAPTKLNLLILARSTRESRHELLDMIEQRCKHKIPIAALLLTPEEFKILLSKGNPFAMAVLQANHWIFEDRNIVSTISSNNLIIPEPANQHREIACWYKNALSFLRIAKSQQQYGELGMTAFCLHQAAEQFLSMLSQAVTGFRYSSHNLDKTLSFLRFYLPDMNQVFIRTTAAERARFQLLKTTYTRFRYKSDFDITATDINYLMNEVLKLQTIAEKIFRSKIAPFHLQQHRSHA
ncbi:HEPN domain-containing protein [Pseudobacter ginsenosidimutans]|uniref:HEPN domain-containing protein n=1 Tax=Pseudobacter ginsenosidimutans TaxID=661488 RepID=A0A4V2F0X6_9BACT|nr:HEPN domain-containing protein [Pseudobacter ginsenosidimutans]QEC41555.1 HEPN domain-containing protein [Pseudobacter ginsenosidimutans]RZS71661.1 HEPN domain-containing protein [Pseudobacter ginsenosidimutans]